MKKATFLFFLPVCIHAATCTAIGAGDFNWDTPSRWLCDGGAPANRTPLAGADSAVIGAYTVTVPAGTSVEAGTGTGDAIWLNNTASRLIVNGNLTVFGHLRQSASASKVEFVSIAAPVTFTLKNSATVTAKWYVSAGTAPQMTIAGSAAYKVTVTTDTSLGGARGFIDPSAFSTAINWRHAAFRGVGTASQAAVNLTVASNVTMANVLFFQCGQVKLTGGTATGTISLTDVTITAFPGVQPLWVAGSAALSSGVRSFTRLVVYGTNTGWDTNSLNVDIRDATFTNCVFVGVFPQIGAGRVNVTFDKCFWAGNSTGSSGARIKARGKDSVLVKDSAFVAYTIDGNKNPHFFLETGSGGTGSPNEVRDSVVDGCNTGETGDFFLPYEEHVVRRVISIAQAGNITDGLFSGTTKARVLNCTFHDTNGSQYDKGVIIMSEAAHGPEKVLSAQNNLFVNVPSGVAGGGTAYVEQTNFTLDYNVFHGLTGAGVSSFENYLHPALGIRSYVRRNSVNRITGNISSAAHDTEVTIPNASTVIAGDIFYLPGAAGQYALITGVGGNVLTLGQRLEAAPGVKGVSAPAAGQAFQVMKNYWASGTYGDAGKGANDFSANPQFPDSTRNFLTWDRVNGGAGTMASALPEVVKVAGYDISGNAAIFNPAYAVEKYLAYIRNGFAPRNRALKNAGSPADGSPDVGALPVFLTFGMIPMVQ
jgi:hypothetical protein